ncbi:MAG: sensor histidine kinase [Kofleriaceae bacterium]
MRWRPLLLVSVALLAALSLLVVTGLRVFERDRDELLARYGHDREVGLAEAARGLVGDVADVSDDLELAAAVLHGADSPTLAERELHAIATIKREYLAMHARTDEGVTTKVTALDAPPNMAQLSDVALDAGLDTAERVRGRLHVTPVQGGSSWLRVFARRPASHGPSVAVVVDMEVLVSRLKLQRDPMSRFAVLDANGTAAASSDRALGALLRGRPTVAGDVRAAVATGEAARTVVDSEIARAIGLPDANAIVIGVPILVDVGAPWTLLSVISTQALQTQERTVVRRVIVGSVLVLVLLLSAAGYVLYNTFRARALRDRLAHADRLAHLEKLALAGQLAAGIAHEIGTPLNVARGRVELSLSHLGSDHAEAKNQRIVIDQIDRVTRLIQQLLDYVRPTPARVQLIDLAASLQSVKQLLEPQAAKREVTLEVDATTSTPILTDADQLQQILVNLTLNAVDACEQGGNVALRTRSRSGAVVLEVEDTGHGIQPELQKHVFDPFFTTKKRGQGTGLGLWIVAQLVRAQSAEIEIDSIPGKGTTVRVVWPVQA